MDLAGNPFECNCRLQPFILGLKENSFRTDIGICLQSNINSLHKKSNCPGMCSCGCKNDGNISFIFADCSSKNLSAVPQFPRSNFTETEIISNYRRPFIVNQNKYSTFHIEDVVLGINLQNNNLGFLDVDQLPPNLIELYLSNNKLRMLPETIFEIQNNVKHASLSGNPWKCDCKATKFKKWLTSKKDFIQDIDNVRCEVSDKEEAELNGKIIWKLTDIDLCSTDIALAVSASFGVLSLVIFCLASKVLYTKYELNIKVFLYSHGFIFLKDEDQNYDKIFDAFVSFSHNDDEYVIKEIISEIENKDPNIHLCLPYRHFLPGKLIQDNITEAVRNSKMTIVILSSNFLDSEWCLLEFRTAHEQSMKDKVHRIIVIKLGELPEKIDSLVKAYIVNTTYLEWGEKNFWNKLIYVLPSRNSAISQVSRSAGNIDFVLSRPFSDLFEL